jgi:NADH:ubiquinone oxidoreductase subunit
MLFWKRLWTRWWWTEAGQDIFGNLYYHKASSAGERRRVIYRGAQEASKVPPQWHGWLHGASEAPLPETSAPGSEPGLAWVRPHRPNLSGTRLQMLSGKARMAKGPGCGTPVQSWKPEGQGKGNRKT